MLDLQRLLAISAYWWWWRGTPAGVPVSTGGLGDLFSLSGGAGLTSGYVAPKTVSIVQYVNELLMIVINFC